MALPEASAWAILIGVVLVAAVVGFRPLLARLAARNIGRRKSRVLIVVAGLLVGTAIISSSLVVGDTLSYIFLEDVYARLDAIDELVSNTFNGQLISFSETNFTQIRADLGTAGSPIDGIAPALLKIMPVRNVAGNKGNQQISVMGLNATLESGFGSLTISATGTTPGSEENAYASAVSICHSGRRPRASTENTHSSPKRASSATGPCANGPNAWRRYM